MHKYLDRIGYGPYIWAINERHAMNRYQFLGVNDDRDFCECCGKVDLKRVVWIEDLEEGTIKHFGVVCAQNPAKAFGNKVSASIRSAATNFDRRVRESRNWAWWEVKVLFRQTMMRVSDDRTTYVLTSEGEALRDKLADIHYRMTYMDGSVKCDAMNEYDKWYREVYVPRKAVLAAERFSSYAA